MTVAILLFILGLCLLAVGGDRLVDAAAALAYRWHMPPMLVGATVVSVGTTLPEVVVATSSSLSGHAEIAYGNAIGSILCNTALIAALIMTIRPKRIERRCLAVPVLFFFLAAAWYAVQAYVFGGFSRLCGVVLLAWFVVYMAVCIWRAVRTPQPPAESTSETPLGRTSTLCLLCRLAVGAALIALGAGWTVTYGTRIAEGLGLPTTVIALTGIAIGTSLPELITAVAALIRGQGDLSLGNVLGASLMNLVLVSGTAITVCPFPLPPETTVGGASAALALDLPMLLIAMLLLCVPSLLRGRLFRLQGIALLFLYVAFCVLRLVF